MTKKAKPDKVHGRGKHIPFVDLFCGLGGFSLGLMKAGFKPILAVDEDDVAVRLYNRNVAPVAIQAPIHKAKGDLILKKIGYKVGALPLLIGDAAYSAKDMRFAFQFFRMVRELSPMAFVFVTDAEFLTQENPRVWGWRYRQRRLLNDYRWGYQIIHYDCLGYPLKEAKALVTGVRSTLKIENYPDGRDLSIPLPFGPCPAQIHFLWGLPQPNKEGFPSPLISGQSVTKWKSGVRKTEGAITTYAVYGHPYQDRPYTLREVMRLRGLPDWYVVPEWLSRKTAWQVVPPVIGEHVGYWMLQVNWIYTHVRFIANKRVFHRRVNRYDKTKGWSSVYRRNLANKYVAAVRKGCHVSRGRIGDRKGTRGG